MAKPKIKKTDINTEIDTRNKLEQAEIDTKLTALRKQFDSAREEMLLVTTELIKEFSPIWKKKINGWKAYKQIGIDRALTLTGKEKQWMTNVVTPLTYVMVNALAQKIYGLSYNNPVQWSKKWKDDEALQLFIEKAQESAKTIFKLKKFSRNSVTFGDSFMRAGLNRSEHRTAEKADEILKKAKLSKWSKTGALEDFWAYNEIEDFTSLMYDTTCNFYESEFLIRRKIYSIHKFYKRWKWKFDEASITEDFLVSLVLQNKSGFSDCNYERYKRLEYHTDDIMKKNDLFGYTSWDFMKLVQFSEYFAECTEKYTADSITLAVNGIPLLSFPNYFHIESKGLILHPILKLAFDDEADAPTSKWLPENLIAVQALHDVVFNAFADQIKLSLSPMFKIDDNLTVEGFDTGYFEVDPYKIIKTSGSGELGKLELAAIDSNIFTMLDYLYSLALIISGVNRYTGGWPVEGVERSAKGADLLLQATQDTLRPIVDGLNLSLNRMARIFIIEWVTKLPTSFILTDKNDKDLTIKLDFKNFDSELIFVNETINQYNKWQVFANLVSIFAQTKWFAQNAGDGLPGINIRGLLKELFKTGDAEKFALSYDEAIALADEIQAKRPAPPAGPTTPPWAPGNPGEWFQPGAENPTLPVESEIVIDQSTQ